MRLLSTFDLVVGILAIVLAITVNPWWLLLLALKYTPPKGD